MKLTQKGFLKGSREFEIEGETVYVRIKSLLKEQQLTVDLSSLDPEPVVHGGELAFYNPHKGHPVFSMLLNQPNAEQFNAFVDALKQKIAGEEVEVVSAETAQSALARNVYEEPPEFAEPDAVQEKIDFKPVNTERLENDISMLKTYLDEESIKPLLDALEVLKAEPGNEAAFKNMMDAFDDLGINQGAVLTYATYIKILVSKYARL